MEARSRAVALPADEVVPAPDQRPRRSARPASTRAAERQRPTTVRATLSRVQEFAFIRSDLRRLVVTAGPLLFLMIALLFVIDR